MLCHIQRATWTIGRLTNWAWNQCWKPLNRHEVWDTAQKGTSITGNVLLETHLYPSVRVLRAYPFPEVWLPGLGASLEIVQLREVPLLLLTLDRDLQTAFWGGLHQRWPCFPTQTAFKLSRYRLSPTRVMNPTALQPCLRLAVSPVDSHPDPDVQADFPAWPQPCLVHMDLPSDCWAVPYPGCPDRTCPARLAQAPQPCALGRTRHFPLLALEPCLASGSPSIATAGPGCSLTLLLIETLWQTNHKVMQDASFLERSRSSYAAWVYSWVDDT